MGVRGVDERKNGGRGYKRQRRETERRDGNSSNVLKIERDRRATHSKLVRHALEVRRGPYEALRKRMGVLERAEEEAGGTAIAGRDRRGATKCGVGRAVDTQLGRTRGVISDYKLSANL